MTGEPETQEKKDTFGMDMVKLFGHTNILEIGTVYQAKK